MNSLKVVVFTALASIIATGSLDAILELWQYAQIGDPAITTSVRCTRQDRDFSFNHLYCLAHQPYRGSGLFSSTMFNLIDSLKPTLANYNKNAAARYPWPTIISTGMFEPYVRKLIVPTDATVFVWSDLHGAALSFFKALNQLYNTRIINNEFKITDPHVYLVFLGDYVDRGYRNILTLYTVLKLASANPEQVILLRGNHETTDELGGANFTLEKEYADFSSRTQFENIKQALETFYSMLPVGLFLGNQLPDGTINYLQLNHGAVELGMDINDFFADTTQLYHRIDLNRHKTLANIVPSTKQRYFESFLTLDQSNPFGFGLIWSDFCTNHAYFDLPRDQIRACYGNQLTNNILKYQTRDIPHATISGIIRGHQHGPPPHLGDTLVLNQGVLRSWDGLVYTINASGELFGVFADANLNEKLFYSSWLQIHSTALTTRPWDIQQCLLSYLPASGWRFTIKQPQNAPAGSADLCATC